MKTERDRNFRGGIKNLLFIMLMVGATVCGNSSVQVKDPYKGVNWDSIGQYKANLHTHTTRSDGQVDPSGVIDMYHDHDYKILSLTDHDTKKTEDTTWPWEQFGKDPKELGMVAIEGNEISRLHHIGSLYSNYGDSEVSSEEEAFLAIAKRDGLAILNHPGRYTESENPKTKRFLEWYCDHLLRHPHILGLEIFNQQDRYPMDRETWDSVLKLLIQDRSVWGFANDDMHAPSKSFGYSWNILLLPKLSNQKVRDALVAGRFFFAHSPKGKEGPPLPVIQQIIVDENAGTIRLNASGYTEIHWISRGTKVHEGNEIDISEMSDAIYVRAMVYGPEGTVVGTQPFALMK